MKYILIASLVLATLFGFTGECSSRQLKIFDTIESGLRLLPSITTTKRSRAKWSGELEASLSAVRGNSKSNTYELGLELERATRSHTFSADFEYERVRSGDDLISNNLSLTNKFEYKVDDQVVAYGTASYERDILSGVELRVNSYYGFGYGDKFKDGSYKTYAGIGSEYEKDIENNKNISGSCRLGYDFSYNIYRDVIFAYDLVVTSSFKDLKAFRVDSNISLTYEITGNIAWRNSYEICYRNVVLDSVTNWDRVLNSSIVFNF